MDTSDLSVKSTLFTPPHQGQSLTCLADLPQDVMRNILAQLEPQTLCSLRLCSQWAKGVVDDEGEYTKAVVWSHCGWICGVIFVE